MKRKENVNLPGVEYGWAVGLLGAWVRVWAWMDVCVYECMRVRDYGWMTG